MIAWLAQQGWRLLQYPAEILVSGLILWIVLNRLTPPHTEFAEARGGPPTLRRVSNFPLLRCLGCSAMLFVVAYGAAAPLIYGKALGIGYAPGGILFLPLWFFGSRWAVSTFFEGSTTGTQWVIFFLYLAVSFGVEGAIGKIL